MAAAGPRGRGGRAPAAAALRLALLLGAALGSARAAVYFQEQFLDRGWSWVSSEYKVDLERFKLPVGKFYGDAKTVTLTIVSLQVYKLVETLIFMLSPHVLNHLVTKGRLVLQYTVKHEQEIDCGGGYVKIFSSNLDQKNRSGDSHYCIMFGPDICGSETKKVHVILNYKNKPYPIKKVIRFLFRDTNTHLYTLIIRPDQTYEVKVDNKMVASGNLEDDLEFLPPRKINDPTVRKPTDWDDQMQIDDPNDIKPEIIFELCTSFCWDDAVNGEWHYPIVKNPLYRGEWKPRQIDNPNYRGIWPHPQIDNSNYSPGFSIYTGTIFDNFLITDDEVYAENFGNETWRRTEHKGDRVTEEKYFKQQFKEKLERKKESGKDRAVRNTIKKEEL
uniref:Calreticulin 3 n=1 Tax=Otus sunia TaxID=257818 RepID=A0A8C8AP59_9STRI